MTGAQFALLFGMFILGALAGVAVLALMIGAREDNSSLVTQAAHAQDAALMDYLERSECNLFFNPTLAAYGLLDGKDQMIATGHSIRTTLARAILNDKAEVANV